MRAFGTWLALVMLLLLRTAAYAQDTEDPCKGEQNQLNMNLCAKKEYDEADRELNAVWKELIGKLSRTELDHFRVAQRYWLKFRDEQCNCEAAAFEGGSMQPMIQFGCLHRLTVERVGHLKNMLESYDR